MKEVVGRTAGNVCTESGRIKGQTEKGRGGLGVGTLYRDTLAWVTGRRSSSRDWLMLIWGERMACRGTEKSQHVLTTKGDGGTGSEVRLQLKPHLHPRTAGSLTYFSSPPFPSCRVGGSNGTSLSQLLGASRG